MITLLKRRHTATPADAIELLMSHHREIERRFEAFHMTTSMRRQIELGYQICEAVRIHLEIGQQLFYAAFLRATNDAVLHREALAEHHAIRDLINEIERMTPSQDNFFAKIHMLCEMFMRHVKREEHDRGVFAQARRAHVDLQALGETLRRRKDQLTALYSVSHG